MSSEEEHHPMTPQERGHKGITHGMTPQERGRRGAAARWKKAHESGESAGEEVKTAGHESPVSPSAKGKKAAPQGMSPHDRGVLGAQARWAKAHAQAGEGGESTEMSGQRGG